MTTPLLVSFAAGDAGEWAVERIEQIRGTPLPGAARLKVVEGEPPPAEGSAWVLCGVTSNERYTERGEHDELVRRQAGLGRREATCAALIPIRKSDAWWELSQGERREVFERRSAHIATGLEYLPAVARRLHHSRDLGEPFDFLTWFEYAPEHAARFDELAGRLRATPEWEFVEREVDIRLAR